MTVLSELMAEAEKADDEFRAATDAVASATELERTAYHTAEAEKADTASSDASLERAAKHYSWREKVALVRAEQAEKAAAQHCRIVLGRLVAAQSDAKWRGAADGGSW